MKSNVKTLRFMAGSSGREPKAETLSIRFNSKEGRKRIVVRAVPGSRTLNADLLSDLERKIQESTSEVPSDDDIKRGKKAKRANRKASK